MSNEKEDALCDGYELVEGGHTYFDGFDEASFEAWLRVGLEGYLLEGQGGWAFPGAEGSIAQQDHLVLGLRDAYLVLSARGRGHFRHAVAKVLASLEADQKNVVLFEHLLALATSLPAPEILRVLPVRVGNGFFGLADSREGQRLFALTLLTAAKLSAPSEEALKCLHSLIGSRHFNRAYAGIALIALCQANDQGLDDHLARLREPLAAMFAEVHNVLEAQMGLARAVLDTLGLHRFVQTLPSLRYFDPNDHRPVDAALVEAALRDPHPLLYCYETEEGLIYFVRSDQREVKEFLPLEVSGLGDLIKLLRENRYVHLPGLRIKVSRGAPSVTTRLMKRFGVELRRAKRKAA